MKVHLKRIHMLGLDFLYKRSLIRGLAILTFGLQQVFSSVWHFLVGLYLKDQVSDFWNIWYTKDYYLVTNCLFSFVVNYVFDLDIASISRSYNWKVLWYLLLVYNLVARWRCIKLLKANVFAPKSLQVQFCLFLAPKFKIQNRLYS